MNSDSRQEIPCEYRASPKNRRIKLSFRKKRGFLVTYPPRTSLRTVKQFVQDNESWMKEIVNRYTQSNPSSYNLYDYLNQCPQLMLNGVPHEILFGNHGKLIKVENEQIKIFAEITEQQLSRGLKIIAKSPLSQQVQRFTENLQLTVSKVTIRDQKSRWGSCSSRGSISLNWRLILMPHSLQEHIILHELAHLIHADHSSNFWDLLRSWDPLFESNKKLLKQKGDQWIRLGREE